MRIAMLTGWLLLCLLSSIGIGHSQEMDDPVFRAMADELERSIDQLVLPDMAGPYFLGYCIQDVERSITEARYGALVQTEQSQDRYLYIDLRVGDPAQDNTGFVATWRDLHKMRNDLPVVDDYGSLRHHLWLHTDMAYKDALENLARKQAYLQAHPSKDEVPDFAAAEPFVYLSDPASLQADPEQWQTRVRKAALVLRDFPALQDWKVTYVGLATTKRYLNSEGFKHLKGGTYQYLTIAATAQAEDGQRLTNFLQYIASGDELPPTDAQLQEDIRAMADELKAMVEAPALEEYAGPVLFTGFGAAQFISQLFVNQLSPTKAPRVAEEWMKQHLPDAKLAGRLNRRVLPSFVSITDEPNRMTWDKQVCAGHQRVDDEGVKCQDITLVSNGRLVDLPTGRGPTKKLPHSNGHARRLPNQWTVPAVTNVVVQAENPRKDLINEMRALCREFGNEYGLLVTRLEDPDVSHPYRWTEADRDTPRLLTSPVVMYRVYQKDGRVEPVRGLDFDEVTIRTLRDIAAMGEETRVTNLRQTTGFQGFRYPVAIITPSILVEEMEFKEAMVREPLPLSSNPVFDN
ncbi:metallopeptidase TldD-related protein [Candidatus Eisenbacteria bacterium]|uniref:Metallopeptidase TldD-related protein n=1 Tax=Eiseniibacteriota bacterium TaxID=2212470 RepID=A0ABV6YKU5_UNCEI